MHNSVDVFFNCLFVYCFQKLAKRQEVLEKAALSARDKERMHTILASDEALQFMSSEESDNEESNRGNGPKLRKSIPLVWERSKLKNLKAELDRAYIASCTCTPSQKRTSASVARHETKVSSRTPPSSFSPTLAVRASS